MSKQSKIFLPELLISRLSYNYFYVIGDAGLDLYPQPSCSKIEHANSFKAEIGGTAANIAIALSQLGISATLVTPLINNAISRLNVRQLETYDVDISNLKFDNPPSGINDIEIQTNTARTLGIAKIYSETPSYISCKNHTSSEKEFSKDDLNNIPFQSIGGLIISGSILSSEISRQLVFKAIDQAKKHNVPIIVELDCCLLTWSTIDDMAKINLSLIKLADIVFGNKHDFTLIAGSEKAGVALSQDLVTKFQTSLSIYKMGNQGTQTFTKKGVFRAKAIPNNLCFDIGAGEAFLAGVLSALTEEASLESAIFKGSIAASIVVSKPGRSSAMPTKFMLNSFLKKMKDSPLQT